MGSPHEPSAPGLAADSVYLKVLTEIDMIAHMAAIEFERLLPENLTGAQYGVLNRLLRLDCTETISELAGAFQVTQPTMTSTINRLKTKNLVDIVPDPDDRRVKRVRVTRKGAAIRNQTAAALEPKFQEFASAAPAINWSAILPSLTALRAAFERRK